MKLWLVPGLLTLAFSGMEASAQGDSARVVASFQGRSPSHPFGAVTDVVTAESQHRIYVLDAMNGEVAVFSANGEPLFHVGRRGGGPGELSKVVKDLFVWADGSFGVADIGNQRVTRWNVSGDFDGDWPLPRQEGTPVNWCVAGRELIAEVSPPTLQQLRGGSGHNKLVRVEPNDSVYQAIHRFEEVAPLLSLSLTGALVARPRPEMALWTADHRGRVLVGRSGKYEIIDISGSSSLRVSRDVEAQLLTDEAKARIRAGFEKAASRAGLSIPEIEYPTHLPVIGKILSTASGEVLVRRREYTETGLDRPGSEGLLWDVFSASGSFVRSVRLPGGFSLKGMVNNWLVGRVLDQFDVPSVVILRLPGWEEESSEGQ